MDNTIVIYTSDQGFFLGDHGWYDKRFIYEESLRMPFVVSYPAELGSGQARTEMLTNTDFAPTLLDYAGADIPAEMQGVSARAMLKGAAPDDWQTSLYYRYWMHLNHHNVVAHYGVRNERYKLIYFYGRGLGTEGASDVQTKPYWELYDLKTDADELHNIYNNPDYAEVQAQMHAELDRLMAKYEDTPQH